MAFNGSHYLISKLQAGKKQGGKKITLIFKGLHGSNRVKTRVRLQIKRCII